MIIKVRILCEVEDDCKVAIRTEEYLAKGDTLLEAFQDYSNNWDVDNVLDCWDDFEGGCLNEIKVLSVEEVGDDELWKN